MNPEILSDRLKDLAISIIRLKHKYSSFIDFDLFGRQIIRSATSAAANYRAARRARSKNEFISKLSIVVEETDETLFWLEILEELKVIDVSELKTMQSECLELVKILSRSRKTSIEKYQNQKTIYKS